MPAFFGQEAEGTRGITDGLLYVTFIGALPRTRHSDAGSGGGIGNR